MGTDIEAGFYWARSGKDYVWYDLIVEVYGEAPFFKIRTWRRIFDRVEEIRPSDIVDWGPRINEPKPTKESIDKTTM